MALWYHTFLILRIYRIQIIKISSSYSFPFSLLATLCSPGLAMCCDIPKRYTEVINNLTVYSRSLAAYVFSNFQRLNNNMKSWTQSTIGTLNQLTSKMNVEGLVFPFDSHWYHIKPARSYGNKPLIKVMQFPLQIGCFDAEYVLTLNVYLYFCKRVFYFEESRLIFLADITFVLFLHFWHCWSCYYSWPNH